MLAEQFTLKKNPSRLKKNLEGLGFDREKWKKPDQYMGMNCS
jgi:hypothetical protein